MADFNKAMQFIFAAEGGFNDIKSDKGGATNYGISLQFLRNAGIDETDLDNDGIVMEKVGDLNNDGTVDKKDIYLLSEEMAKKVYFKYFWLPVMANVIDSQKIATCLFDMAINSGKNPAVRTLQKALNLNGAKLLPDGDIGPKTMDAIFAADENKVFEYYLALRQAFYDNLVKMNPSQAVFQNGWKNRLKNLKKYCNG